MRPPDEQSLIQQVQDGKTEAFGALMDVHLGRLRATIALRAPAPHLVDEIAHETFVYAYTHIREFRRGTSFFSWLRAIARNLLRWEILCYARERTQRTRYALAIGDRARPEAVGAVMDQDAWARILEPLPPRYRELLELRYRVALSTAEIAGRVARSEAWVRTRLSRIRERLRHSLEASALPGLP